MSDVAFAEFTEQVLSLSYEQTIILMGKMLESLKTKRSEENYAEMEKDIARSSMNTMWEELKNDTWWNAEFEPNILFEKSETGLSKDSVAVIHLIGAVNNFCFEKKVAKLSEENYRKLVSAVSQLIENK